MRCIPHSPDSHISIHFLFLFWTVFISPPYQPKLDKIVPELEAKERERERAKQKAITAANQHATEQFAKRMKKRTRCVASVWRVRVIEKEQCVRDRVGEWIQKCAGMFPKKYKLRVFITNIVHRSFRKWMREHAEYTHARASRWRYLAQTILIIWFLTCDSDLFSDQLTRPSSVAAWVLAGYWLNVFALWLSSWWCHFLRPS